MCKDNDLKQQTEIHNHHTQTNNKPNLIYKCIFTAIFIPFCLFAISHYIAKQVAIRGASYVEFNMHRDSIRLYRKSLLFNRRSSDSWYYLGYSYMMIKDYENSVKSYKKALEIDPDNLTIADNLALSYALKGDYVKAIDAFRVLEDMIIKNQSLEQKQRDKYREDTLRLIATCYTKLGETEAAKSILNEYLKSNPDSIRIKDKLKQLDKVNSGSGVDIK